MVGGASLAKIVVNYKSKSQSSFILNHQNSKHEGAEPDLRAKVTARTRDCLTRQIREAVLIRRSLVPVLNGKSEWYQPPLYRVQQEMERGRLKAKCCPSAKLGQTE